ncbi:MAG TPA: hypothetical protein VIZ68_05800 [Thermoplasmata archaeon]
MVDLTELEVNVLEFVHKSFAFSRIAPVDGEELAVFHRTETESESQFRPKLLRLFLVVPRPWILYDLAADLLVLGRDGHTPGHRAGGTAVEAAAETSEFSEQGIDFRRFPLPEGWLYVPADWADRVTAPASVEALGLPTPRPS